MNEAGKGIRSQHIGGDFPLTRYTVTQKDIAEVGRILERYGLDESTGLTAIDLLSIPAEFRKKEAPNISKIPLWKRYLYTQFPKSEEITEEQYLLKIKKAAEDAMHFLREILDIPRILVPAPTSIDRDRRNWLEYIKSAETLEDLEEIYQALQVINKSKRRKNKISQDSLIKHVALCAFVKTTAVMFTLNDGRIEIREKAFTFLDNALRGREENIKALFEAPANEAQASNLSEQCNKVFIPDLNTQASYCARLKSMYSSAMKLILSRKADLKQALKDAVGIRIELSQQDIPDFINHIIKYFESQKESFAIEDFSEGKFLKLDIKGGLLDQEVAQALQSQFPFLDIKSDEENDKSSAKYKDIKLRFRISYQGTPVNIEIQILHEGHRNESGFSNHILYDLKKKVLVMQRLYGVVPRKWLGHAIDVVSKATRLSADKIWETLLSSGVVKKVNRRFVARKFYREKPLQK